MISLFSSTLLLFAMILLIFALILLIFLVLFALFVIEYVEQRTLRNSAKSEDLRVREWAKTEDNYKLKVTLDDGTTWYGHNLWWWSDQGNAPEELCRRLYRFQNQVSLV